MYTYICTYIFIYIYTYRRIIKTNDLLWSGGRRQPDDKYQKEENIAQTVVITTYCNEHKAPSGTRFFKTHREHEQKESYFLGIGIRLNEQLRCTVIKTHINNVVKAQKGSSAANTQRHQNTCDRRMTFFPSFGPSKGGSGVPDGRGNAAGTHALVHEVYNGNGKVPVRRSLDSAMLSEPSVLIHS